jgi:hypothetical protein
MVMTTSDDTISGVVMVLTVVYMLAQSVSIVARILRDRVARESGRCVHHEHAEGCRCVFSPSLRP